MNPRSNYLPSLYFKRTPAEKIDQYLSWIRDDKAFFAAGACHILGYTFIGYYPEKHFDLIFMRPKKNLSGNHVYVSDGSWAFDFNGWTRESELIKETTKAYKQKYPNWEYDRIILAEPLEEFCENNYHRLPKDFYADPIERAIKYINRFPQQPQVKI